ncbi:MAG: PA2169 family four-helix-bundle protein [Bacteroidetes bacterium]|nr:PA2169 family four-helix-bundle protein [Bacteroidota bacterium]MBP7398015.1 PA2169 family four-helix-bundle protein [Chitinophagales bacterium]MBK7108547.1 PA2169 family four-helix-bundle protein [Bacteroidota bacterium]MBK8489130.1 PA2169 family four-helix-bundle protein [Bacteroidota bacterium]MBK8680979.1 PA2169 family four-helix-bundle protein [Bacteroidota bacterium]
MTTNKEVSDILNDLILINNDRIEGYEKAIKNLGDGSIDLKATFNQMVDQSRGLKQDLVAEVGKLGGDVADGTTNSGKIYRAWMDVKATFTGNDRQTALNNCEFGEDAAQKAYNEALKDEDLTDHSARKLVSDQKDKLKRSHDIIKGLRDVHKALS